MYFGHREALDWFARVAERVRAHPAVAVGRRRPVRDPHLPAADPRASSAFAGTPVRIGAQDVATEDSRRLHRRGQRGRARRDRRHARRDRPRRAAPALRRDRRGHRRQGGSRPAQRPHAGAVHRRVRATRPRGCRRRDGRAALAPTSPAPPPDPSSSPTSRSGRSAPPRPRPPRTSARSPCALRAALEADPERAGSSVIYGGSAGPGLLTELGDTVDGLFLGRFAHDPAPWSPCSTRPPPWPIDARRADA